MPIYEYQCQKCEEIFEKVVFISEQGPITCPKCKSKKVEQLICAPAIHNTSSKNDVLHREYRAYRKRWKENAYMPKAKKKVTGDK